LASEVQGKKAESILVRALQKLLMCRELALTHCRNRCLTMRLIRRAHHTKCLRHQQSEFTGLAANAKTTVNTTTDSDRDLDELALSPPEAQPPARRRATTKTTGSGTARGRGRGKR